MKRNGLCSSPVTQRQSIRLLTNFKTVESAPLIPKKHRFSGPSLEPSWNQITGANPYNETVLSCTPCEARITSGLPTIHPERGGRERHFYMKPVMRPLELHGAACAVRKPFATCGSHACNLGY